MPGVAHHSAIPTTFARRTRQFTALLLWLAPLPLLAVTLRQENFESAPNGVNYAVVGEHNTNSTSIDQYFKRGGNAFFYQAIAVPLLGLHGAAFWAGEDTGVDGPGECLVTLGVVDVSGHQNLKVTWALASPRDAGFYGGAPPLFSPPFDRGDYMILQTALNGAAWTNVSVFRGPAGDGFLREDTNNDGIGDGTKLTRTFTDFQYTIPGGLGTGVQVRVLFYMSATDEEAAFDDIRITGDGSPPVITITNPPGAIAVNSGVTTYNVQGTALSGIVGNIAWTNSLTGLTGTIPASTNWTIIPAITLGTGINTITVTGTNTVVGLGSSSVSINRIPAPTLTITDPAAPVTVGSGTATRLVAGTANPVVGGLLNWSNALSGATGTTPAVTNWLIAAVPVAPGLNVITVRGTNDLGSVAAAQAVVAREGVILLNEVLANPLGTDATDTREFIELLHVAGGGNASDLSIIELSGNAADKGVVLARWNLLGLTFGTNGLLAVGDNYDITKGGAWSNQVSPHTRLADAGYVPDALVNTSITLLLVRNCQASVVVGADLDTNNDGVLDLTPWDALLDCVGWKDADPGDAIYCTAALTQSGVWPTGASRLQTNRVPNDPSAWFNGDVMTFGGDTLGRTYNPAIASANLPSGAVLTPGRPNFPFPYDQDADGLPNTWEQLYFGGPTNAAPGDDSDMDGLSNQDEYWAGTDPKSAADFLEIAGVSITDTPATEIYTNGPSIT
ncbi:MAG: hypothetical protein O3B24_07730, partial [Verrucomicrobia bacterium]|nr:hypothetical protein [Verrucomicrobiota bacterium]